MAELVYAFDLKSNGAIRTGSSPVPATIFVSQKTQKVGLWCFAGKSRSGYHFYFVKNSKIPNTKSVTIDTKSVYFISVLYFILV